MMLSRHRFAPIMYRKKIAVCLPLVSPVPFCSLCTLFPHYLPFMLPPISTGVLSLEMFSSISCSFSDGRAHLFCTSGARVLQNSFSWEIQEVLAREHDGQYDGTWFLYGWFRATNRFSRLRRSKGMSQDLPSVFTGVSSWSDRERDYDWAQRDNAYCQCGKELI